MQFEWDDTKNELNIQRHKIDFADVPMVFNGPLLTDLDERFAYDEERWISIGLLATLMVVVVWTERGTDTIRFISARKAERQRYETYIANRLGPFDEHGG